MFEFLFKNRKSKKELLEEIDELNGFISKQRNEYEELRREYREYCGQIKVLEAKCITEKNNDEASNLILAKKCLCDLLAEQLLPYMYHEQFLCAGSNEIKHFGSLKVVKKKKKYTDDELDNFWEDLDEDDLW